MTTSGPDVATGRLKRRLMLAPLPMLGAGLTAGAVLVRHRGAHRLGPARCAGPNSETGC